MGRFVSRCVLVWGLAKCQFLGQTATQTSPSISAVRSTKDAMKWTMLRLQVEEHEGELVDKSNEDEDEI